MENLVQQYNLVKLYQNKVVLVVFLVKQKMILLLQLKIFMVHSQELLQLDKHFLQKLVLMGIFQVVQVLVSLEVVLKEKKDQKVMYHHKQFKHNLVKKKLIEMQQQHDNKKHLKLVVYVIF